MATRPLSGAQAVTSLSEYVSWVTLQGATELDAERTRLQSLPESADRNLRLALLHGTRGSAAFNPQLCAQLLIQVAASEPQGSVYAQLAHLLFASQPDPAAYDETKRLSVLSNGLTAQLNEQQTRAQGLESQLETARRELDSERSERARLENQLKALKSLEAQIKGRDEAKP
jgi:hypothetical protein